MNKKLITMGMLSLMLTFLGCKAQTAYKSVGANEFENLIVDSNIVRLDVRTSEEYTEGHIARTLNIDVKQSEFLQRAKKALPKDKTIAVYCRSGVRSKKACDILSNNGYTVVDLTGGIMGWQSAGKPTTKEEVDIFTTRQNTNVNVYCIKHGTIRIEVGGKWIYVDPVTTGALPATDYTNLPKADYILVTHEHRDHLDKSAIEQLTKDETILIVNPRSSEILGNMGEIMKNGDTRMLAPDFKIEAVPAYNNSTDKQQFHPCGRDNGYILTICGLRIYIAGDTEDIDEMADIKDIDIAFMPCNLPYTMTPEQLVRAANIIQPHVLFPYHYGKTEIQKVQNLLDNSNIDVRIRQYQ